MFLVKKILRLYLKRLDLKKVDTGGFALFLTKLFVEFSKNYFQFFWESYVNLGVKAPVSDFDVVVLGLPHNDVVRERELDQVLLGLDSLIPHLVSTIV